MTQNEWNKLIAGRVSANTATSIANSIDTNLIQAKADRVAKATERKAAKLQNFKNSTNPNDAGTHDFVNQQEEFGRLLADERVYSGKELLKYDPTATLDELKQYKMRGSEYVPFDGKTRNAYIRNLGIDPVTGEQLQKFGLARNDLTDWAKSQGITPEQARYMDKDRNIFERFLGLNKIYKGKGGEYDGTPGHRAESQGEALFDAAFDADAITEFELKRYMDRATIAARAIGTGPDVNSEGFGGGKSEYTVDRLDPLFNIDAPKFEGELPEGTQTPRVPRGYNTKGEKLSELEEFEAKYSKQDESESSFSNALKGFGHSLGEGVISTLDLVPEAAEYAYKNIVGDGQAWSETEGMYNKEDAEAFKEWTGYNEGVMNNLGKKAVDSVKKAWNKGDYWGLVDTVWEGVKTPELVGTSLGYVAGLILPGTGAKKVVDLVSGVNKIAKAIRSSDKTLTKSQALARAGKEAGPGYKIANIIAGNVGYVGGAEQFARDAEDLYKETYNEEMPAGQKIAARVGGLLFTKMDAGIAKAIVLGKDPIAKMVPSAVKALPNTMKVNLMGKIAVLSGATAARVTGAFGLEALTEGVQTSMEKVAGLYKEGEKDVGAVLEEQKFDIAGGALLGGAGGVQMTIPTTTKKAVELADPKGLVEKTKKSVEKLTETEAQKQTREYVEFTTPLKEEAQTAATTGSTDEVVNRAEKMHGKLAKDLDESAPKSYTYGVVLRGALNKAHKSNDETAIKNVYKTIAELDAREDVDFKATDIVEERMYEATKEFISLINESPDTVTSKMAELGKDVEDSAATTRETKGAEIFAKVKAMQESIAKEKEDMKSVMGSEQYEDSVKAIEQLEKVIKDYIQNKDLSAVNTEIMELGFIEQDSSGGLRADPNKPGLKVYERELTKQMLDPKTNENLLNDKVLASSSVSIGGLKRFAESRLKKLNPSKNSSSYQTAKLMENLLKENSGMLETINNLVKTADKLGIPKGTKEAYKKELLASAKATLDSAKELERRQKLVNSVDRPEGSGQLAYQVDPDGTESIQLVNGKDRTLMAEIVNNEVVQEAVADSQPDEVGVSSEPTKESVEEVKTIIKEKAGKPEEYTKEEEQIIENAKDDGTLQLVNKELTEEVLRNDSIVDKTPNKEEYYESTPEEKVKPDVEKDKVKTKEVKPESPKSPLEEARKAIDVIGGELKVMADSVDDMNLKVAVKNYYTKELEDIKSQQSILRKAMNTLEKEIEVGKKSSSKLMDTMKKLALEILAKVDQLMVKLGKAKAVNKKLNEHKKVLISQLERVVGEIESAEVAYSVQKGSPAKEKVNTSVGEVTKYKDSLYGPMVELWDKRKPAVLRKKKKGEGTIGIETALKEAANELGKEQMNELRSELKGLSSDGKTSLGAKLLGRLLKTYPINSPIHKIVNRGSDSVFGQMNSKMFEDSDKLLEVLPKGFKDFFMTDEDSKKELLENFATMNEYIKSTKFGDIKIDKTASLGKHIDVNGLAMKNVKGKDGKTYNFPVEMLELIGTTKDGVLQIDEQTETILKFYSAKMLSDTQRMIGLILSMDESEMAINLGIADPEEQLKVKQEARQGYVNSASVRSDIGSEVYQALGIKFNELAPEFTSESFKSALGVLVQTIAIDNGSMSTKSDGFADKNQNLIRTNWEQIGVEREPLIKAINKLQYLNENRSRPLPKLDKPEDKRLGDRTVMNTQNSMDAKSNEFLNNQEKTAYTISPRLQRWLDMDENEALKAMGYVNINDATELHVSEIDAQIARNDKLVREWDILKAFANATKDKKFYLDWGQTVSGRYTILNDIQYQESKLHREFVVAEGSTATVDPKNADDRQMLEASIMQGLDMDPDKLSAETATENFNKLFKVTDKGIEVTKEGPVKQAYEAMRKGEVDIEAMAEVFANSEGHHGISSIELLVDWDKAIKNGTNIETHANLEIDAITSGMILTLLQIGSDQALALAEKGGIYTEARKPELEKYVKHWLGKDVDFTPGALIEAGKKHASAIENGTDADLLKGQETNLQSDKVFKDLYSTIGVAMVEEVEAYKAELEAKEKPSKAEIQQLAMLEQIGTLNLKNIRSIAKSPVMVYIYGATTNSIKKKLTYSLGVDTLVKAIKSASKQLKKDPKSRPEEMDFIKLFIDQDKVKYVNEFGVELTKDETPKEAWKKLLAMDITGSIADIDSVIRATFGTGIETAFENKLGFVDKNRDAAKSIEMLVFEAYQIRLADEVNALLTSRYGGFDAKGNPKHKGEAYKLSKADMQDINEKLTAQGFGHNIVWDEEDTRINQSLNKTSTKGGKYSTSVTVGDTKQGGQIKQFKPAVNTGAAPTISIHAIDGRMMLDVLNRELDGKYSGGNVYDAVVLSVNKDMLTDTADSYNTNMIETGFGRSIVADQLGMLENMVSTMNPEQKKKMFVAIGLRPEGELNEDYTKEANRLNLSIGKMLERIELAEEVNKERLANSAGAYYSGHLFQMGSGLVKIDATETRAKAFPAIDSVKKLLKNKLEADRKVTQKEFGGKLSPKTNYVFNLDDITNRQTQVESKANIAQMKPKDEVNPLTGTIKEKITVSDKLWDSLSSNDVVEVIGNYELGKKDSRSYWFNEIIKQIENSYAGIVTGADLTHTGRELVEDVWVKVDKSEVEGSNINQNITNKYVVSENVTELKPNQVFVFGSNEAGRHGKGAALTAKQKFGAAPGQGIGLQGKSYGVPTKNSKLGVLDTEVIKEYVDKFIQFARRTPKTEYLVTALGTGLAGISPEVIADLFKNTPDNVKLPKKWEALGKTVYTVQPNRKPDMTKAKQKASKATKYIGYGKKGSSTELYANQLGAQGMPVNVGEYNSEDVVFVSVNGTPTKQDYTNTLKQVIAALEAGATVLTDSEEYLKKSTYNKGEKQLAKNLLARGYVRTTENGQDIGVWIKPKKVRKEDTKQKQDKMTANELTDMALECAKG